VLVPGGYANWLVATVSTGSAVLLLAATPGGLYRSEDRGTTWVRSDAGLAAPSVESLAASPTDSTVLYAVAASRLFRSQDEGRSWVAAGTGLPPVAHAVASAADPRIAFVSLNESVLATPREGIYRTTDGGATWIQTGFQLPPAAIHYAGSLFVDPASSDRVFAGIVSCDPGPGFGTCGFGPVRSEDGGATWSQAALLPSAADGRAALYDGGTRWTDHGMTPQTLQADGQLVGRVFASAVSATIVGQVESGDLFSSMDSGETWSPVAPVGRTCEAGQPCVALASLLCLAGGRFRARVAFGTFGAGGEILQTGFGHAVPLTLDAGAFWFFSENNIELVVKVVSGEAVNGHWWVFIGALTDVDYDLEIDDTLTGARWTHHNDAGTLASVADTNAFASQ
jgi:hypothetical protein